MKPRAMLASATIALGVGASAAAHADPGDGRIFDHYGMMGWGGWFYGPFMIVLFIALLAGAVIVVARLLGAAGLQAGPQKTADNAHAILRTRFAKGEISKDEFEASRKVLDEGNP